MSSPDDLLRVVNYYYDRRINETSDEYNDRTVDVSDAVMDALTSLNSLGYDVTTRNGRYVLIKTNVGGSSGSNNGKVSARGGDDGKEEQRGQRQSIVICNGAITVGAIFASFMDDVEQHDLELIQSWGPGHNEWDNSWLSPADEVVCALSRLHNNGYDVQIRPPGPVGSSVAMAMPVVVDLQHSDDDSPSKQ